MNHQEATELITSLVHRIAPEVDLSDVDPVLPLQEAFDLDSMDFLNLMTALEARTGIDVPERDYPLVSTIDGLAAYVAERSAPPAPTTGLPTGGAIAASTA